MGELTRAFAWETTPLGSYDSWPLSLRTTVGLVLRSRFPMFLWWGPELIQFYNDAYRPSLGQQGKHPTALGQRGEACWPETWPTIKPLIDQVMGGGKATWSEDQLIPIYRNGRLEDVYWTFSYSAACDDQGHIGGVLVTCTETTQAVLGSRAFERNQQAFRHSIAMSPVATALFRGPQFIIEQANDQVLTYWGRQLAEVLDKPLFDALPEARDQGFEELLMDVYTQGHRFVANELSVTIKRGGRLERTYIDFVYEPYRELDGTISGVTVVCVEVTERVVARQQVEASEARYRDLSASLEQQVQTRTAELEASVQDLIRANENLQQFAYIASHDLQEPLRKIQAFSTLITEQLTDSADASVLLHLERITLAGARMSLLIKDLLTYSRIATRQQAFGLVSLEAVMDGVLSTLDWDIQRTKTRITIDALPVVKGDESQLGQLFQNLLSNAMKFVVPERAPVIQIQYFHRSFDELPDEIRLTSQVPFYHQISVSDNGVGFDTKFLSRIFQVFQRLYGKNQYPGTGVGLAICQRVVENHGGGITANSEPGQGATFCVYLPE
ncbi:PAS domain-containing protein [Fibrella sp. HMF5405]|uniref:histidine kinase n=2 Tax=Fibrella forsythiae TaxID=2817061 RepID=A0ABS3JS45_9BACT|nr:PAS domain-containing protein [Fibrella forsythiae]